MYILNVICFLFCRLSLGFIFDIILAKFFIFKKIWRHIKIVAYMRKKSKDQNCDNFSYFDKISLFIDQKSKF
jgi:hypothetical protein